MAHDQAAGWRKSSIPDAPNCSGMLKADQPLPAASYAERRRGPVITATR
jgi:hypothetical protein